ncbi:MAG: hypothetical protein IJK05_07310 [Bacteroidales bacterium]|nr:hypothetical protein [Bacteroidales bacterium]
MKTRLILASLLTLATFSLFAQEEKEPVKKYGFKSAIIKLSSDVMGQAVESTVYIDDYGAKECQKVKVSIPGMGDIETATIAKDGKAWSVNYTMKQVQEVDMSASDKLNFLELTDEIRKKYNIQEAGVEKVLDLECQVYTLENEAQGVKAKIKGWIYKGMTLKSETEAAGMTITVTPVEFKENAVVLPQVFDVPKY